MARIDSVISWFKLDSNQSSIESSILEVLEKNPNEVERYKNGEFKLLGFFMGQVMKLTKGKADPSDVSKIIAKLLKK